MNIIKTIVRMLRGRRAARVSAPAEAQATEKKAVSPDRAAFLKEYRRQYQKAHRAELNAKKRIYMAAHPEMQLERNHRYRAIPGNREKMALKNKEYYAAHREERKEKSLIYREANTARLLATQKAWRERNRKKCADYQRAYDEKHKEALRERRRAYNLRTKERRAENYRKKRDAAKQKKDAVLEAKAGAAAAATGALREIRLELEKTLRELNVENH